MAGTSKGEEIVRKDKKDGEREKKRESERVRDEMVWKAWKVITLRF